MTLDLARHLVESRPLLMDRRVNQAALEELFHMLMVINPSIAARHGERSEGG